jgi:predicted permease
VVTTLALGIGANTAIFSVIDALLLRALPVADPGDLALLSISGSLRGSSVSSHGFSYPVYRELRDRQQVFSSLFCRFRFAANVGARGETRRVTAEMVSGEYFRALGVSAALGRTLTPEDDRLPGRQPVAVLSHDYWASAYGKDPDVLGRTITVNGEPLTVIGVSQRGFTGVEPDVSPAVRVPITMSDRMIPFLSWIRLDAPRARWVQVFGRLKPGVSRSAARTALDPVYQSVVREMLGVSASESTLEVLAGSRGLSDLRRGWAAPLWALLGMVGVVLLLACVNVAGLLIGRGVEREGELALRMALGGGRGRIVSQLLLEGVALAMLGGIGGALLAPALVRTLTTLVSTEEPLGVSFGVGWRVLAFCAAATVISVLVSAVVPAILSTRLSPARVLGRTLSSGRVGGRARTSLVCGQVCLSLVLVAGAALFMRSLQNLYRIDPGFRADALLVLGVDPLLNGVDRAEAESTFRRLEEKLDTLPGVSSAALGLIRVLNGDTWGSSIVVRGYQPAPGEAVSASMNAVSPGYFETLGIPVTQGRDFTAADDAGAAAVAIVNQSFARRYLGDGPILGRRVGGVVGAEEAEIVGLVGDTSYDSLRSSPPPQVFLPYPQMPFTLGMNAYVRTRLPADQMMDPIRRAVRAVDPRLPVQEIRTLEAQRDRSLATERMVATLATAFGALAILLASVGLYGILSQHVAERRREIGVRTALGAARSDVLWLVVKRALTFWAAGALAAVPITQVLGRLIAGQLVGIEPDDPWTLAGAAVFLAAVLVAAAAAPAMRASRIDPAEVLRSE